MKIANRDARPYVAKCVEFDGSNLFARWEDNCYIVYSYGKHFPMFICAEGQWFANRDKYSRTTSKHYSQCFPYTDKCTTKPIMLPTHMMLLLATSGYTALISRRLQGDVL